MTTFDDALALVLVEEGGKVDNPKDPGGRTAYGVTQRTFDGWQDAHHGLRRDVWTITPDERSAIYRNAYADPIRFDALPAGVGYAIFDDVVNSGIREGVCELQRALGVSADGAIGALTLAAVASADPTALIGRLCDGRLTFLRRLKAFVTFGRGWSNRVAFVRSHALAMASASRSVTKSDAMTTTVTISAAASQKAPSACPRPDCPLRVAKAA